MPRALRALLTLVVAGALGVAGAGAAHASAYGASTIPPFTYTDGNGVTKSVPRGCVLIHSIIGEGTDIRQQTANVDCAGLAAMRTGLFCDAQVQFVYTDARGADPMETDEVPGCRTLGLRLTNGKLPAQVQPGKACVQLYVGGALRAKSCHVVHS